MPLGKHPLELISKKIKLENKIRRSWRANPGFVQTSSPSSQSMS